MAFTATNVSVPASGGGAVLVYSAPDGVPTDVTLSCSGNLVWLLSSSGQTPSTGYLHADTRTFRGLVGDIYAAGYSGLATTVYVATANTE